MELANTPNFLIHADFATAFFQVVPLSVEVLKGKNTKH